MAYITVKTQPSTRKSLGQLAYEQDLAEYPNYGDGSKRKTWEELSAAKQCSWERRVW